MISSEISLARSARDAEALSTTSIDVEMSLMTATFWESSEGLESRHAGSIKATSMSSVQTNFGARSSNVFRMV